MGPPAPTFPLLLHPELHLAEKFSSFLLHLPPPLTGAGLTSHSWGKSRCHSAIVDAEGVERAGHLQPVTKAVETDPPHPPEKTGAATLPPTNHPRFHFTSTFLRAPPAQVVFIDVDNLLLPLQMVVEEVVEKPPLWSLRLFSSSPSPSLLSSIPSSSLPRSCHILILHQHFRLTMSVLFCSGAISGWMGWMGWKLDHYLQI